MIHLKPTAPGYKLYWIIGEQEIETKEKFFCYTIHEYSLSAFSVFSSLLNSIRHLGVSESLSSKLDRLLADIKKNVEITENSLHEGQTNFLASAVTYAIMRRISRESAYTSSIIDQGAKLLNELLREMNMQHLVVRNVDFSDSLSLKILGRSILINKENIEWKWLFSCSIFDQESEGSNSFTQLREKLFLKLRDVLMPQMIIGEKNQKKYLNNPARYLSEYTKTITIFSVSKELVLQNYDFCVLACAEIIATSKKKEIVAEAHRISGLALINAGLTDEACNQFEIAEMTTGNVYKKAHISYLQGLAATKRHYSLALSEQHYQRGMKYLDSASPHNMAADQLERAWIYNGIAMNQVVRNKKDNQLQDYRPTFDLLINAFKLVQSDSDPAREYLRFNLIANMGFLMEIYKNYGQAIRLFEQTFDNNLYEASTEKLHWNFVLSYRIGLLKYKSGNFKEANAHFEKLLDGLIPENIGWYMYERMCRAAGYIKYATDDINAAISIFNRGLSLCVAERSHEGASYHGKGLMACFYSAGETGKCTEIFEYLKSEDISIVSDLPALFQHIGTPGFLPLPSPKLPAYIPELDFEDVPKIDINQYLVNNTSTKVKTW